MRAGKKLLWIALLLALGGMGACATDTELNPQPLPPGQNGDRKNGEDGENAPSTGAGGGSSGSNAGPSDASAAPDSDAGTTDSGDAGEKG